MPQPDHAASARVLVTGASGFLGGYVVRDLQAHGYEVFAAGRDRTALARVADAEHVVVGDLDALADLTLPVDAVIHCAALSTPWGAWPAFRHANVDGTRRVIDFAMRNGVRRIVHVSSPSVYAAAADRLNIAEGDVDQGNRLNGYIRSKIEAEAVLRTAQADGRIAEVVIIRPRGLIGVGDPSLIPRLLDVHARVGIPLFNGGRNLIDVTAVENVADALRLALDNGDPACGVYNITNGDPRPFTDLLDQLIALLGLPRRSRALNRRFAYGIAALLEAVCTVLPHRPEPPLTRYTVTTIAYAQTLDISRAVTDLGYTPRVPLDDALHRFAAQWRGGRA